MQGIRLAGYKRMHIKNSTVFKHPLNQNIDSTTYMYEILNTAMTFHVNNCLL